MACASGKLRLIWTNLWTTFPDMRISVSDAKAQLTDLVRRAEAGEEVVLTRHGHAAVRLVPVAPAVDQAARRAALRSARQAVAAKLQAGGTATDGQDFLYGDDGLPQ